MDAFAYLPIAAIVNSTSFCIHGGISPHLDNIKKITKFIQRPIYSFDQNLLLTDLLWSDPSDENGHAFLENPRGRGKLFNNIAAITFLKNNNLQRIIRAHECVGNGIEFNFNDKCITVFSASSYDRDLGNKCGIIKLFEADDKVESIIFHPFRRLKKFDTLYFKVQMFNGSNLSKPILSHFNLKTVSNSRSVVDQEKSDKNHLFLNLNLKKNFINPLQSSSRKKASCSRSLSFTTGSKSRKSNNIGVIQNDSMMADIPCFTNFMVNEFGNNNDEIEHKSINQISLPSLKNDHK